MYYGGMGGFGLEDLAQSEMGMGQQDQPVVSSQDIPALGQDAAQVAQLYAQYMVAKNPSLAPTLAPMLPQQPPKPAGLSLGTKLAIGLGIGAASLGALVWVMSRKKSNNKPRSTGWKSIGE